MENITIKLISGSEKKLWSAIALQDQTGTTYIGKATHFLKCLDIMKHLSPQDKENLMRIASIEN